VIIYLNYSELLFVFADIKFHGWMFLHWS
jgi:hypothetical protein